MSRIFFTEEQKFDQLWLRILILMTWIPFVTLFGFGLYRQLVVGKPWGNNPASDTGLILTSLFILLVMTGVTVLVFTIKLITEISDEGLSYRFPPLILRKKTISKSEISEYAIRKYNPVGEYGGWGIRMGLRAGKAFNVKGNMGLQLTLKDGKKILFGTQRPDALLAAIDKLMKPAVM